MYIYIYKKPLFYLEFTKHKFKKIKKFKVYSFPISSKFKNLSSKLENIFFLKKNNLKLTLKKPFLKKSLYNNKFFFSKIFSKKKYFQKKNIFKKKNIFNFSKFILLYLTNERLFFLKTFFLKNKKQHITTRFLLNVSKYSPLTFNLKNELYLMNILTRTRFSLSPKHAFSLLENKVVYVNYKVSDNRFLMLKTTDIIQLVFFKGFFFFYKYSYNVLHKRFTKLNYYVWRIQLSKKRKNKQPITSFPSWLSSIFSFPYSIPKYLEVDFSSLTAVIVRSPNKSFELNPFIYWNFNYHLFKLLNWKRIT